MSVKLTDVAKRAGVSPTTVSRVINKRGYLSQETITKVTAAMAELNYQPNSIARSLQGKKSHLIGLIFPSITQPFYAELVEELENYFFSHGYKCILCDSQNQIEKERHYLNMLAANKVDGIIAGAHNIGIDEYHNLDLPIISFDRNLGPNIPIVGSDNYQGGKIATEALVKQGCTKIGIITGSNKTNSPTKKRLTAYKETIINANLTPLIYTLSDDFTPTMKKAKIMEILQTNNLDGLFCTDDLTALTVWNLAKDLKINIPKDLKLIGYDGTNFIQNYAPFLSTIKQPIYELGTLLAELLIKRIDNDEELVDHYTLPPKIIYQESLI